MDVIDEGTLETVETTAISASDDTDDENAFIELLGRTLRVQFDDQLSFDRESKALYFRAKAMNKGLRYLPRLRALALLGRRPPCTWLTPPRRHPRNLHKLRHYCSNGPCLLWSLYRKWVGLGGF
jgi:hypothetical protein